MNPIRNSDRKTFYFKNDVKKPIRASGVMMYRIREKILEILIIEKNDLYEDIGGRVDQIDKNYLETAAREFEEETNGVIKANQILGRLYRCRNIIYISHSKYLLYIIKANQREEQLTSDLFGNLEKHDQIIRKIKWISINFLYNSQKKLNPRINKFFIHKNLLKIRDRAVP